MPPHLVTPPDQQLVEVTEIADEKLHDKLKGDPAFGGCLQRDGKNYVIIEPAQDIPAAVEAIAVAE